MNGAIICHCLIGCPASGKSTLANELLRLGSAQTIISTDRIRQQLYGDEAIQGSWPDIEAEVFEQLKAALSQRIPVVYDATNAQRQRRMSLRQGFQQLSPDPWVAWHLITPLEICLGWNQNRPRQVPVEVIQQMATSLAADPPTLSEGWLAVIPVDMGHPDFRQTLIQASGSQLSPSSGPPSCPVSDVEPWG